MCPYLVAVAVVCFATTPLYSASKTVKLTLFSLLSFRKILAFFNGILFGAACY